MTGSNSVNRRKVLQSIGAGASIAALSGCLGGGSGLQDELDEVESATSDYSDPQAAYDDGYIVPGQDGPIALGDVPEQGHAVCGMGYHFVNREQMGSADKTEPQVLAYGIDSAGEFVLGAVEYVVPKEAGYQDAPPDLFENDDGEEESNWEEDSPMEGVWSLHAWVHHENPEGVFHPLNPDDPFHPEGCEEVSHSH
jgi:hypothetical protein